MQWARKETARDAVFLIGGAEYGIVVDWFPEIARRPVPVSPWGTKLVTEVSYNRDYHFKIASAAGACATAECYSEVIENMHEPPDYVVTPVTPENPRSFRDSDDFSIAYRNKEYLVVEHG